LARILRAPEIVERLQRDGTEPVGGSPDAFARHLCAEIDKWGKVIRTAGIGVD
jgi:tripartite-type tricarboxylate transporter receptor subunit TctC